MPLTPKQFIEKYGQEEFDKSWGSQIKKSKAGRPVGSYKHGQLSIFQYRQLKAKIRALKSLRHDIISEIIDSTNELLRIEKIGKKIKEVLEK